MSTLRINNIEAQSIPASPTIDEKVKVTNSSGDILVNIDGKTSGITTIGINTTDGNIKFDANSNVLITGILTATTLAGNFTPTSLEVGSNIKLGNAGVITATSFVGSGANLTGVTALSGSTNNTVCTVTGANAIQGESNLTFDGTQLSVTGSGTDVLKITSTNAGDTGANLLLHHNSASPADNDIIGVISFRGEDDSGAETTFSELRVISTDVSNNSESGDITFHTRSAGTFGERLRITSAGKIGIGHHIATQITKELTIRPVNDGGILIGRPGDTVAPINSALTITTTTTGSEAYHTKYHTYNCNSIFATYEGGGTGGNLIFKTGVGNGNESERLRIDSSGDVNIKGGNLQVGTDSATVNFTNSNSTGTKFIEIGATGANSDSLLVVHSSGYGVGYFGFDAANERLIMATDAGGTHKIAFCLDAGTGTGGGSDNIGSATPALEIDNQKNITVGGVGTFGGGVTIGYNTTTYSPIQKSDNTWFYTRLDQSSSISGTNIINLAQGSNKISESIPRSVMTRQSDAGSYSLYHSSTTNGSAFTNFSAADPFSPRTYGLTMGCLVRLHESGNNGSGVIFYGDTGSDNHFFVRYKYSSGGLRVGEDTNGSDVWTLAYPTDRFTNNIWYFLVFAVAGNGTLYVSLNGEEKIPIRTIGSPPTPTDARFGICGDPYTDNDSRHRYATMFWYKGLMPNDMIKAEYDWLKTIWTGASLP